MMPIRSVQFALFAHPVDFPGGLFTFQAFPLVIKLLALGQSQFDFRSSLVEVDLEWNKGETLFLCLSQEPFDFKTMEEEFPHSFRIVVVVGSVTVRADMQSMEEYFVVSYSSVAVLEVGPPLPQRLYLGTGEYQPRFDSLKNIVIVVGFFILAYQTDFRVCCTFVSWFGHDARVLGLLKTSQNRLRKNLRKSPASGGKLSTSESVPAKPHFSVKCRIGEDCIEFEQSKLLGELLEHDLLKE